MLMIATAASAQSPRAQGPFAGLFGAATTNTQTLDLRGSLFAAYQDVIVPDNINPALLDTFFTDSMAYGGANASLSYGYTRQPSQGGSSFSFSGIGGVSQYSQDPGVFPWNAAASASAGTKLTRRIDLSAGAGISYSPYFTFGDPTTAPPGGVLAPSVGFAAVGAPTLSQNADLALIYNLSRRASASINANYYQARVLDNEEGDARSLGGGGTFRYQLTRGLSAHAGYTRQVSWSSDPSAPELVSDYFDVGLDYGYSKGFTLGRRTTAVFSTSTGIASDGNQTHFRLEGSAGLNHGIGRTWAANVFYSRSSGLMPGYSGLVFSDSASASFGGQVVSRLNFSSGASWTRGEVGFDGGVFNSYSANATLNYGLFTRLGMYVAYGWFKYSDPAQTALVDVPPSMDRQTLTAGVTVWQPLISPPRGRTPR